MGSYLIRRLLLVIPTLWAIITINFFIVQIYNHICKIGITFFIFFRYILPRQKFIPYTVHSISKHGHRIT